MISICICTYNRSQSLRGTLTTVTQSQNIEGLREVIVVDNNSNDATPMVVEEFKEKLPIRRVLERSQGLSHARNRAVLESKGTTLLFTDDDVLVHAGWLSAYASAISRFSNAHFFGGRILPQWTRKPPRWFRGERLALLDGVLVWYDHGIETRPYAHREEPPFGASFAVKRSLLEEMSGFRTDLGCKGSMRARGEETEFFQRCIAAGKKGIYVGDALCWHKIEDRRLTLPALYRYGIESGRSHSAISRKSPSGSLLKVPLHLLRGVAQMAKGRGDRFRQCVINAGIEVGKRAAQLDLTEVR